MRALVYRQHDQKNVGENRRRVYAEGNRGDVIAAGAFGQLMRLPGIKNISGENGKRHAGQNARGDHAGREAAEGSERGDQQQVGKPLKNKAKNPSQSPGTNHRAAVFFATASASAITCAQAVPYCKPIFFSHCR